MGGYTTRSRTWLSQGGGGVVVENDTFVYVNELPGVIDLCRKFALESVPCLIGLNN